MKARARQRSRRCRPAEWMAMDLSHSPRAPKAAKPVTVMPLRIAWIDAAGIATVHLLALLAFVPWFFSWTGVILAFLGLQFFGTLGIGLCYHRMLTHRSFVCPKWLEHTFAIIGLCCLQDTPARWVAIHRQHHHQPTRSPIRTARSSIFSGRTWAGSSSRTATPPACASSRTMRRDIMRDPFYSWLEQKVSTGSGSSWRPGRCSSSRVSSPELLVGGGMLDALQFGLSLLVWGVFVRTVRRVARHLVGQFGDPSVGLPQLRDRRLTAATTCSSAFSPTAKAGTTTTTPIRCPPSTATAGGNWM